MREQTEDASRDAAIASANRALGSMSAPERVAWALQRLPGRHVLSSSFGAQAAVSLHLVTSVDPDVPVILVDTGYLFPETYRFIDRLTDKLNLNLAVYRPAVSAAWQEARHGRRWEDGLAGIEDYNRDNKIEPMQRALKELDAGTWIAGVRRSQSASRLATPLLAGAGERFKLHPIADWSDYQVYRYLKKHDLPYHPLWERGYVSIGDVHTTRTLADAGGSADATRFFGLKRECGLHEMDFDNAASGG
ncbi:MAG: phosphoadenylyl-sulfate reductase [Pseudomonadota bacterium]